MTIISGLTGVSRYYPLFLLTAFWTAFENFHACLRGLPNLVKTFLNILLVDIIFIPVFVDVVTIITDCYTMSTIV